MSSLNLLYGDNTLAIEIHKVNTDNDMFMDAELLAVVPSGEFLPVSEPITLI